MRDDARDLLQMLRRDGVVRSPDARLTPLTGGVSSEIYRVDDELDGCPDVFVVKRALARLKVKQDWFADVGRNATEAAFLKEVGALLPDNVPGLRTARPEHGYFAMDFLGSGFENWKSLLLSGRCEVEHAVAAGKLMGTLHRRTAHRPALLNRFDTTQNFEQLRIGPYLLATGQAHPHLRDRFETEAQRLRNTRECLIHGDFSPKNILIRTNRMVLLDCEVAWYGDPSFDAAFLLNHLFLKSIVQTGAVQRRDSVREMIGRFWSTYVIEGPVDGRAEFELQTTRLLTMLMLARVDGKSPAEYLNESQRSWLRGFASQRIATDDASTVSDVTTLFFSSLHK